MTTIKQTTEHDLSLIEDEKIVKVLQNVTQIYIEKRNIKLFISQLILLDNDK